MTDTGRGPPRSTYAVRSPAACAPTMSQSWHALRHLAADRLDELAQRPELAGEAVDDREPHRGLDRVGLRPRVEQRAVEVEDDEGHVAGDSA